jgi:hypothetical protein
MDADQWPDGLRLRPQTRPASPRRLDRGNRGIARCGYQIRWLPVARDDGHGAIVQWEPVQADGVVISAGTASRRLAAQRGDQVTIDSVKGSSITVHLQTAESQEAAPCGRYRPRPGGGGSWEAM